MNIRKEMEAVFLIALAGFGVGSVLVDYLPEAQAQAKPKAAVVARNVAAPASMPVVVIRAHRVRSGS